MQTNTAGNQIAIISFFVTSDICVCVFQYVDTCTRVHCEICVVISFSRNLLRSACCIHRLLPSLWHIHWWNFWAAIDDRPYRFVSDMLPDFFYSYLCVCVCGGVGRWVIYECDWLRIFRMLSHLPHLFVICISVFILHSRIQICSENVSCFWLYSPIIWR